MPGLISAHHHLLRPDHLILILRDIDSVPDDGASSAIASAGASIAASSELSVYIETAQNLIPVRMDIEVWDGQPDDDPTTDGWTGPTMLDLACPTGQLLAGDDMGNAIDGIDPPTGPGQYAVAVLHQGRDAALGIQEEILQSMAEAESRTRTDDLQSRHEGLERYLLRVWWLHELNEDDHDDL
jgi:hypothetical protein